MNEYRELKERWEDIFEADMGAEAILDILKRLDLNKMRAELLEEIASGSEQRKKKAMKALRVVEAFRRSGNKPEWMILRVLPVLPPDLRPMVQLEGGRFASSDLNDLYRRVINRNNRLKKLLEMEAPDIIIKNEKRMLQEAVDALIDNGRKARPLMNSQGNRLKSLSDLLRGKQGRFRQNLLGKRVDYSGRSVIVVGPELKLHECGLPKKMALELFKPFVIRRLIARGLAHSIRSAKRMVERARPEVWEILEEVVKDHPVLLNRAPTLHRLSIQAFMPRLIDSEAIQLHPLVCPAFNADFDGDQMAVHVPLSKAAIYEAKEYIMSTKNMLLPSSGEPIVAPTLDIVFGCYWLSLVRKGVKGEGRLFSSFDEVKLAYEFGEVDLHALVKVKAPWGEKIETTPGRIILNEALPEELRFVNDVVDKKKLKNLVAESYRLLGNERTAEMLDRIKELGYHYATLSGMSMSINDLEIPPEKKEYIEEAERELSKIERQYERGLITDEERYRRTVDLWDRVVKELTRKLEERLDPFSSIAMMANSGAKGNITQIRQMACMRGLMSDPSGKIIDMPIRSSLKEGLPVLEYFISTHGARKGLADTALRTSDSGYLTRRLIDVAHEVLVREEDCGTDEGIWIEEKKDALLPPFEERILGRIAQQDVVHDGEVIVRRGEEIDEEKAQRIKELGISRVYVRSPLTCRTHGGVCRLCYGRDIARRGLIRLREAVGIIAAQSIGEPGTQLTMRTFHTGGVAGYDITLGLPRVEELFEARVPKGQGYISDIDGVVKIENTKDGRKIRVISTHTYVDGYPIPEGYRIVVEDGKRVDAGDVLAVPEDGEKKPIKAKVSGTCEVEENRVYIRYEEKVEREYLVPLTTYVLVKDGQEVRAGDQLTEGPLNPHDILRIKGKEAVQRYLIVEIQKVYRSQGVSIHDKHIEVIIRQMMKCVRIDSPGDTEFLAGDLVARWEYEQTNARVLASGGGPATAHPV
ncbi:MAG: DNA-directed RNA polymerase subunit beta', partial [Thermoplasmata archaeon]